MSLGIRTRIATIITNDVAGIVTVFPFAPKYLPHANLPACVILLGNGTYAGANTGNALIEASPLTYNLRFFWQEWTTDNEQWADVDLESIRESVETAFQKRPQLQYDDTGLDGVIRARLVSVSGEDTPQFYPEFAEGMPYLGLSFQLTVSTMRSAR